ncbi:inhibin alpha chain [Menidia menidia]
MFPAVLVLGPLWIPALVRARGGEEPSRGAALSRFRERVLEGLGLDGPPPGAGMGFEPIDATRLETIRVRARLPRRSEAAGSARDRTQMIVFPSSANSSCSAPRETVRGQFAYYFQPSNLRHAAVTSAHFWLHVGEGASADSSAPLFVLDSGRRLLRAESSPDGWTSYLLDQSLLASVASGPFAIHVGCPSCPCRATGTDRTPFLHVRARPRAPARSPRQVTVPWSPSAVRRLQRPSGEEDQGDCRREEVEVAFRELGWEKWIVHPEALTFSYCRGNCSVAGGRSAAATLWVTQCCAPVPGTMRSAEVTTTSDGGHSFRREILPDLMPEECACF